MSDREKGIRAQIREMDQMLKTMRRGSVKNRADKSYPDLSLVRSQSDLGRDMILRDLSFRIEAQENHTRQLLQLTAHMSINRVADQAKRRLMTTSEPAEDCYDLLVLRYQTISELSNVTKPLNSVSDTKLHQTTILAASLASSNILL
ncbi:hypothetical protein Syun_030696 [Stephania yunnanensis]|uniref:Uncharacterized protein n=1 Tax=Stephania yunnanensis TaxID=152371 RepID=A0AAP0HDS1_9MAGN